MRNFLIAMALLLAFPLWAKKRELAEDKFILTGKIYEMDIFNETDKEAGEVQIVIYQNREIYVSFVGAKGNYEFVLPIGHEYEVWFGGSQYVNKKVYVDARPMKKRKSGYECVIDIGLFKPIANYEFACLIDHFVKVRWDQEYAQLLPDYEYCDIKARELQKAIKRAKKVGGGY